MQSRRQSIIEIITSTVIGFAVSMMVTFYLLPAWGLHPSVSDAWGITALYTGVSMVRSYLMRRWFNRAMK